MTDRGTRGLTPVEEAIPSLGRHPKTKAAKQRVSPAEFSCGVALGLNRRQLSLGLRGGWAPAPFANRCSRSVGNIRGFSAKEEAFGQTARETSQIGAYNNHQIGESPFGELEFVGEYDSDDINPNQC